MSIRPSMSNLGFNRTVLGFVESNHVFSGYVGTLPESTLELNLSQLQRQERWTNAGRTLRRSSSTLTCSQYDAHTSVIVFVSVIVIVSVNVSVVLNQSQNAASRSRSRVRDERSRRISPRLPPTVQDETLTA